MDATEPNPKINTVKQLEQIVRAATSGTSKKDEVLERIKKRRRQSKS